MDPGVLTVWRIALRIPLPSQWEVEVYLMILVVTSILGGVGPNSLIVLESLWWSIPIHSMFCDASTFWEILLIFLFRPAKSHDLPSCAKKKTTTGLLSYWCRFLDLSPKWWSFLLGGAVFGTISHLTGAREGFEDPMVGVDLSLRIGHVFRDMSGIPFVTFAWWNLGRSCCIHCESHFKWTLTLRFEIFWGVLRWTFLTNSEYPSNNVCNLFQFLSRKGAPMSVFLSAMGFYGCVSTSCKSMLLMGLHDPTKSS